MITDYTKLNAFVKAKLKPSRYTHSLGVMEMALNLASRFGIDEEKARISAIYHDAYRYEGDESSIQLVEKCGYVVCPEERENPMLLHGALAAVHFDEDTLSKIPSDMKVAVRHHTLGHVSMGRLGAVIYIADYGEKGRKHVTDKERKKIMSKDTLEDMVLYILEKSRAHLAETGKKEAGVTKELYDFLKEGGKL